MTAAPENEAVLAYLETERLPSWKNVDSPWIVDGYSLQTHPDLCERVEQINAALNGLTEFRWLFGRPALLTTSGVIVAFATGTHVFCVRLRREDCEANLVATRLEPLSRFEVLRSKQLELDALTDAGWTRLDPWALEFRKDDAVSNLAAHVEQAVFALRHPS